MNPVATRHFPFPTAVHSYFTLTNRSADKKRFLQGKIQNPSFEYRLNKTLHDVQTYQEIAHDAPDIRTRLELVKNSILLREDAAYLGAFRSVNETLYRAPNAQYVEAILSHYGSLVKPGVTQQLWDEIQALIGKDIPVQPLGVGPSSKDFLTYQQYLNTYTQLPPRTYSCAEALQFQLDAVNLSEKGWRVRLLKGDEHAHTYHHAQTISIGRRYAPRSTTAAMRIAAHEVIGHALRGPQASLAEAEGVAIVLEQLTGERYKMRRSYRYLAIALGWGVLTAPMTFREVYEVLWRLMVIGGRTEESAKSHAYDECCRAFRGGRPDTAGAVFLKDAVYFDATIRIWEVLVKHKLSYNEFVDVIEGRRTLLS